MLDLFPYEEINEFIETKPFCSEVELIDNCAPVENYDLINKLPCEEMSTQQQLWNELPLTTAATTANIFHNEENDPPPPDGNPNLEESSNVGFDGLNGVANDYQLQQQQIMNVDCNDIQNDPFSNDVTNLLPDQQVIYHEDVHQPPFKLAHPQDFYTTIPGYLRKTFDEYEGHLNRQFEENNFYHGINEERLFSMTQTNPIDQNYAVESGNLLQLYQDDSPNDAYNHPNQQYIDGVDPYNAYAYPDYLCVDQNDFYNHRDQFYEDPSNCAANDYVGQNMKDVGQELVHGGAGEGIESIVFQETIDTNDENNFIESLPFSSQNELLTKPNDKPLNSKVDRLNISESFDTLTSNYNSSRYSNQESTRHEEFIPYPPVALKPSRKSRNNKPKKFKPKSRLSNKQLEECFSESVEGEGSSGFPRDLPCVACGCHIQRQEILSENESFGQSASECVTSVSTTLNAKTRHTTKAENKHKSPFQLKYLVMKTSQDTQGT